MPYDFTDMWNLKNEQAEQKKIHRHREHFDGYQMEGVMYMGEKDEWIKKYKLVFTE